MIPLVGLCLGSPGDKYAHFDYARDLIDAAKQTKYRIALIVGGDFSKNLTELQRKEFLYLSKHIDVLFIPRYVRIYEGLIDNYFEFFWRGYRDLSVSYTMYVAASIGRPVLALNFGFVGRAIREYDLGVVVNVKFSSLEIALDALREWCPQSGIKFLASHSWDIGAERLRRSVSGN